MIPGKFSAIRNGSKFPRKQKEQFDSLSLRNEVYDMLPWKREHSGKASLAEPAESALGLEHHIMKIKTSLQHYRSINIRYLPFALQGKEPGQELLIESQSNHLYI